MRSGDQSFLINPDFDDPVFLTNMHKNESQMRTKFNVKIPMQIDSIIQPIQ